MDRVTLAQLNCPAPVTWTADIKGLFTPLDIDHMKKVHPPIDLSSYESVKIWAAKIYQEVSTGGMPPAHSGEAAWNQAMINKFGCWMQQGCPM